MKRTNAIREVMSLMIPSDYDNIKSGKWTMAQFHEELEKRRKKK